MSSLDTRQESRDSFLFLAEIRAEGQTATHRVRVRNLSEGGMMAEGEAAWPLGTLLRVKLRNIGEIEGSVAWIQDNRSGIAFIEEIDPKLARSLNAEPSKEPQRFMAPPPPLQDGRPRSPVVKI